MKRFIFGMSVFLIVEGGFAFVGPSLGDGWGVAGLWYRLRTYPTDWTNAQDVFGQFRFLSWMMLPSWGSLPVESLFLWGGPYLRAEVMMTSLFRYDGAIGVIGDTLIGFAGNFLDKDGDGNTEDDSFWGTTLGLGPQFRYLFGGGWAWTVWYKPEYCFYNKMEKTEITLPEDHWTHRAGSSLVFTYDEGTKASVSLGYNLVWRGRDLWWGYDEGEVLHAFDQGVSLRGLSRLPLEGTALSLKIGGEAFWWEKTPRLIGVSANVFQEEMASEVRGYHEEEIRTRVGVILQTSLIWEIVKGIRLEMGVDGAVHESDGWKTVGGAGFGVRWQWRWNQAFHVEYNYPLAKTERHGQIVAGFMWLFGEEGL